MTKSSGSARTTAWVSGIVVVLLLYLLSVPPVHLLCRASSTVLPSHAFVKVGAAPVIGRRTRTEIAGELYAVPYLRACATPLLQKPLLRYYDSWAGYLNLPP